MAQTRSGSIHTTYNVCVCVCVCAHVTYYIVTFFRLWLLLLPLLLLLLLLLSHNGCCCYCYLLVMVVFVQFCQYLKRLFQYVTLSKCINIHILNTYVYMRCLVHVLCTTVHCTGTFTTHTAQNTVPHVHRLYRIRTQ